jgi:hypothetical protein
MHEPELAVEPEGSSLEQHQSIWNYFTIINGNEKIPNMMHILSFGEVKVWTIS